MPRWAALIAPLCLLGTAAEAATLRAVYHGTATMNRRAGGGSDEVEPAALPAPVALDKAILFFNYKGDSSSPSSGQVRGQFQTNQMLRFYRGDDGGLTDLEISWTVVEFESGVFVQRNSGADPSGNDLSPLGADVNSTSTITLQTPVTRAESFALVSVSVPPGNTTFEHNDFFRVELGPADSGTGKTSTLLVRHEGNPLDVRQADWQVVEYTGATVHHGAGNLGAGAPSASVPLQAGLDLSRTFALLSWTTDAADANTAEASRNFLHAALLPDPALLVERVDSGTTLSGAAQVVTLNDGARVQQSTFEFPDNTSATDYLVRSTALPAWSGQANSLSFLSTAAGRWGGSTSYNDGDDIGHAMLQTLLQPPNLLVSRHPSGAKWGATAKGTAFVVAWPTAADLTVSNNAPPSRLTPSQTLTTNFRVENTGPTPARDFQFKLDLQGGALTSFSTTSSISCPTPGASATSAVCTLRSLAPNSPATITMTAQAAATPGQLHVHAEVSAFIREPTPANNATEFTVPVGHSSDLALQVTPVPAGTAPAGSLVEYAARVENRGATAAGNLQLTTRLPAGASWESASQLDGWTCSFAAPALTCSRASGLAAGASTTPRLPVRMPDQPGTVDLTFDVSSSLTETDLTNNRATVSHQVTAGADLETTLQALATVVAPGGWMTYLANVTNRGPSEAQGLTLDFALPSASTREFLAGSGWTCPDGGGATFRCTLDRLVRGASASVGFSVWAPAALGAHEATATVNSATDDPVSANDAATAPFLVGSAAFDDSTLLAEPSSLSLGELVTFTVTVKNSATVEATNVTVSTELPAGLQAVEGSAQPAGGFPGPVALGNVAAGGSATFRFQAIVTAEAAATVDVRATIAADSAPSHPLRATLSVTTPTLELALEAPDGTSIAGGAVRRVVAKIEGQVRPGSKLLLLPGAGLQLVEGSAAVAGAAIAVEAGDAGALLSLPEAASSALTSVEFDIRAPSDLQAPQPLLARVTRNAQPLTPEQSLIFEPQPVYSLGGCSCGMSGGGAGAWLALAGVAAAWRRRRASR